MFGDRKAQAGGNSYSWLFLFLASYLACLIWLLPKLSLWLDEILDLIGAGSAHFGSLIDYVRGNAGAVPLGYLAQAAAIHFFGLSAFSGRLPSTISSVASCLGIYFLARRASLRWPLLPAVVFALCPVQFRYALEARGYALALAFSIWSTVIFISMIERPRAIGRLILYGLCVVGGLYTQPFSLFVPLSHLAWIVFAPGVARKRSLLLSIGFANVIAILLFLPWYLYAAGVWRESLVATHWRAEPPLKAISLLLRELVGMGYIGTGLALTGVALAAQRGPSASRPGRLFWLLYLLLPIGCVFAADAAFGYFLAIRQMIFVLTPLCVLFGLGVESLIQRNSRAGAALAIALLAAAVWNDFQLFERPRENWQAAAGLLETEASQGACVWFAPDESRTLYLFFRPELAAAECRADILPQAARVALAVSPYDLDKGFVAAQRKLLDNGLAKQAELNPGGPLIEVYGRNMKP